MKFKLNLNYNENELIKQKIESNYAQKSSPKDRMLDLDPEISTFGSTIEKRDEFARDRDRIIYSTAFRD